MPDEKFVAYIDILGFEDLVSNDVQEAEKKLTKFYKSIYYIWKELEFPHENIKGLGYSDSLTIYTDDATKSSLEKILKFVPKLYKESLFEHRIMLRGGLAKGTFNMRDAIGFNNLEKNLFIGQAFINAYKLENKRGIKGCRFVFETSIKDQLTNYQIQDLYPAVLLENQQSNICDLVWINKNELCDMNGKKLNVFYELAKKYDWSEQYSRTLDLFCLIAGIDKYDFIKQKILESSKSSGGACSTI